MDICQYDVHELIGEGSFGKVYKARYRQTNNVVAYKVISKSGRRPSEVNALRSECEIQKNLRHPNIIRMLDAFETDGELIVITEFAQKDLCQLLKEEGVFPEIKAKRIICNLISALFYLHSNRIIHRDLKPQNVLLDSYGSAKLCDFGFARVLGNDNAVFASIKGTPLYMAPELMNEFPYDYKVDLWSLGCISYELVTGHPPYTTSNILHLIEMIKVEPVKWPNYVSELCLSFLKKLLQKNPRDRSVWPDLLYHPFISSDAFPSSSPVTELVDTNTMRYYLKPQTIPLSYPMPFSSFSPSFSPTTPVYYHQNTYIEANKLPPSNNTVNLFSATQKSMNLRSREQFEDYRKIDEVQQDAKTDENDDEDLQFTVQKGEWLDFLRKTIRSIMRDDDVYVLTEEHSLKLIMNAFNGCHICPVVISTVAKLLSLPFVLVSESNTASIRQTYYNCEIIKDLLTVTKKIVAEKYNNGNNAEYDEAVQHLFMLISYLIFSDKRLFREFFNACVSLRIFEMIKKFLTIRTKHDSFSVVHYVLALFLRMYIEVPQSRHLILEAFENSIAELHSILRDGENDSICRKICTVLTTLSCTQFDFLKKSDAIHMLIEDVVLLKNKSGLPLTHQIVEGTLEVLISLKRRQQLAECAYNIQN